MSLDANPKIYTFFFIGKHTKKHIYLFIYLSIYLSIYIYIYEKKKRVPEGQPQAYSEYTRGAKKQEQKEEGGQKIHTSHQLEPNPIKKTD